MDEDSTKLGLGIPYLILIFLTWLNAAGHSGGSYYYWVYSNWGGLLAIIGCLFLIPVFILTIIFISTPDNASSESAAFGLAVPAWLLILIGSMIGLYYTVSSYIVPIFFFIFVCPQIILGCGLFARRDYGNFPSRRPTPGHQPIYPSRRRAPPPRHVAPRAVTPHNRGGNMRIPEEVRLASTMGQTLKRCPKCNHTLDARTQVCFFCGARQPATQAPPRTRSPAPQMHAPTQAAAIRRDAILFCPNCGAKTMRGALFCTRCGSSLE